MSAKLGKSVDMLNGEYVDWTVFMDDTENYDAILATYMSCVECYSNTYIAANKQLFNDYFNNLLKQYGLNPNGDPDSSVSANCNIKSIDLYTLHQKYKTNKKGTGIYYKMNILYDKQLKSLTSEVYGLLPELDIIAHKYNYSLELIVEQGRTDNTLSSQIDITSIITESDKLALNKLHDLWNQMNIVRKLRYMNVYVDRNIEQLKNKRLNNQPVMDRTDIYKNIYMDAQNLKKTEAQPNEFAL